jgi:hypothetical protein
MHLNAKVDAVNNGQWAICFADALTYQSPDYGDLVEKIKTKIILDENDLDLERCHEKWMVAHWGLLERNNMMSFHEKLPKKVVEALVYGIRPLALKQLVRPALDLDHKHIRNSVLSFFDFAKEKMRPHLERARAHLLPRQGPDAMYQRFYHVLRRLDGAEGAAPQKLSCWGCKGAHSL